MKNYNITVNGITYAVAVEETGGTFAKKAAPAEVSAPSSAPKAVPKAAPKAAPAPAAAATAGGSLDPVAAPMPGTVLDVQVSPGQAVKSGDILLILEAMKMENEIMAPAAGTIDTVSVAKGAAVNAGDVLVTFK